MTIVPLTVEIVREGGTVVVAVGGEVDLATAPALRDVLTEVVVHQGNLSVRVDLAEVTFMDSTGLNVLVGALKKARFRHGNLTVTSPNAAIRKLFELSGLASIFSLSPRDAPPACGPRSGGHLPEGAKA